MLRSRPRRRDRYRPEDGANNDARSALLVLSVTVLLLLTTTTGVTALSTPTSGTTTARRPIERVAVVGAGIAGLTLAHALTCHDGVREVVVYDSRASLVFDDGAGVQLNGGMSVLRRIDPALQRAVAAAATPLVKIRSRSRPDAVTAPFSKKKSSNGKFQELFSTLLELDVEENIRTEGGDTEQELIVDGEVMSYSIMRGALQEVLLEELRGNDRVTVEFDKTLTGITEGVTCSFRDGSTSGPFDLVVGCDGIRSNVKDYVDNGRIDDARRGASSIYSGLRIRFAVQDGEKITDGDDNGRQNEAPSELRQYFGDGGYGLVGTYGAGRQRAPSRSALLVYQDPDYVGPFPKRRQPRSVKSDENADWTQSVRVRGADPKTAFLDRLDQAGVPAFELRPIIEHADRLFELGVYFHSPFGRKGGWRREVGGHSNNFCVLAGDAAHALPPFLGQGSNQAIQDAYCLANKVAEYNTAPGNTKSLDDLLGEYESQRWWPTTELSLKAAFLGYLEAGSEGFPSNFRDAFFFTMGKIGVARKVYLGGATPKV